MATADTVREKALSLALAEATSADAVRELLACCSDRRVPIVLAHQQILQGREPSDLDPVTARAVGFLEQVLEGMPADG
jgi:hypothetical protein